MQHNRTTDDIAVIKWFKRRRWISQSSLFGELMMSQRSEGDYTFEFQTNPKRQHSWRVRTTAGDIDILIGRAGRKSEQSHTVILSCAPHGKIGAVPEMHVPVSQLWVLIRNVIDLTRSSELVEWYGNSVTEHLQAVANAPAIADLVSKAMDRQVAERKAPNIAEDAPELLVTSTGQLNTADPTLYGSIPLYQLNRETTRRELSDGRRQHFTIQLDELLPPTYMGAVLTNPYKSNTPPGRGGSPRDSNIFTFAEAVELLQHGLNLRNPLIGTQYHWMTAHGDTPAHAIVIVDNKSAPWVPTWEDITIRRYECNLQHHSGNPSWAGGVWQERVAILPGEGLVLVGDLALYQKLTTALTTGTLIDQWLARVYLARYDYFVPPVAFDIVEQHDFSRFVQRHK